MTDLNDIIGNDVRVDVNAIEKSLAELWRGEHEGGEHAVTRAALWNVVAHTGDAEHHATASETLGRASAAVPQRTIVVRANRAAEAELASWISANCHLIGGGKQVCSEEISIVAGGERVDRVPPVISALLIPDMPVAVWWVGDLPNDEEDYVESLLEPADRFIVDSVYFDSPADIALISRVAERTATAPADLNWIRLDEWRTATASVFDPPAMRERLNTIRRVRVVAGISNRKYFGETVESLLFASWLTAQLGHHVNDVGKIESSYGALQYQFEGEASDDVGGVSAVEISFADGSVASISRDLERGVLLANVDGTMTVPQSVTRTAEPEIHELIVRQLKRAENDQVLLKVLPVATRLARRFE